MRRSRDALTWLVLAGSVACTTNSHEGGVARDDGAADGASSARGKRTTTVDGSLDARTSGPEVLVPLQGGNLGHVFVDARYLWYVHGETVYEIGRETA